MSHIPVLVLLASTIAGTLFMWLSRPRTPPPGVQP
jgi:hypothetical protein